MGRYNGTGSDDDFGVNQDQDDDVEILQEKGGGMSQSAVNSLKEEVKRGLNLIDGCVNQLAQAKWILINVEKTLNSKGGGGGGGGGASTSRGGRNATKTRAQPPPPPPAKKSTPKSAPRSAPASKSKPPPKKATPKSTPKGRGGRRAPPKRGSSGGRDRTISNIDEFRDILHGEKNLKIVLDRIDHLLDEATHFKGYDLFKIEDELESGYRSTYKPSNNYSSYMDEDPDDELFSAPKEKKAKEDSSAVFDSLLKPTSGFKDRLRETFLTFSQSNDASTEEVENGGVSPSRPSFLDDDEEEDKDAGKDKENDEDSSVLMKENLKAKLRMAFEGFSQVDKDDAEAEEAKPVEDNSGPGDSEDVDESLMSIVGSINQQMEVDI